MTAPEGPVGSVMRPGYGGPFRRRGRAGATNRKMTIWLLAAGVVALAVSIAGLITLFVAWPAELWTMVDVQVYVWGGHMARLQGTPYQGAFQIYNLHLYFTYPPMAAAVFWVVSDLPLAVVKWLITSASVASLAGVTWLSWGKLGYRRTRGRLSATLLVTAIALWLEPVQQTLAFGQVNAVLMLVVVADLCLPDGSLLKGVGVGLAAGFKLTPLIFVPYLLLTRRYRAAVVALGTFGFTIAASDVLLPKAAHQFWARWTFLKLSRVGNVAYIGNQSLYGALIRLLGSTRAAHPYYLGAATVIGLAGLLLAAGLSWRGHELAGVVTCALTGLLVSPVSWSHHWVWIVPTLVVLTDLAVRTGKAALRAPRRVADRLAFTAAGLAVVAVLALTIAYPFHAAPGAPRLPAGLIWTVPPRALQGLRLTGYQELIANLYVLVCLVGLTAVGVCLLVQAAGQDARARAREGLL